MALLVEKPRHPLGAIYVQWRNVSIQHLDKYSQFFSPKASCCIVAHFHPPELLYDLALVDDHDKMAVVDSTIKRRIHMNFINSLDFFPH